MRLPIKPECPSLLHLSELFNKNIVDNYTSLCVLMLMKLKTELEPFDRLRLHKAALLLEVFSKRSCFKINDGQNVYYSVIDSLSQFIKQFQTEHNADTPTALNTLLNTVEPRVKESYLRSIPYIIQCAGFINSISDNKTLTIASFVLNKLQQNGNNTAEQITNEFYKSGYSDTEYIRKDIITTLINLEKSGVIIKEDTYSLVSNYKGVTDYKRLL